MGMKIMSAFLGRDKGQVPAVIACAKEAGAEVLCLQEVMDFELSHLKDEYEFVRFVPMTRYSDDTKMGLVTCSNLPVVDVREQYYWGDATTLPLFDESTPDRVNATKRRPLLTCGVHKKEGLTTCWVGNTHFLYSKDGKPGRWDFVALNELVGALAEHTTGMVLCGAMVMPRGGDLYTNFVNRRGISDHVPNSISCTLDEKLHKLASKLTSGEVPPVVVDYIFSVEPRPGGIEVQQFHGISDHTPLLATF